MPAGPQVRSVYLDEGGVIASARRGALLIDCSTIDVETARAVAAAAKGSGFDMLDAPVSGGVAGSEAASLTFMVRGEAEIFARAQPTLAAMGPTIVHAGQGGNGQGAKILQQQDPRRRRSPCARRLRPPNGSCSRPRPCSTSVPNHPGNAGP